MAVGSRTERTVCAPAKCYFGRGEAGANGWAQCAGPCVGRHCTSSTEKVGLPLCLTADAVYFGRGGPFVCTREQVMSSPMDALYSTQVLVTARGHAHYADTHMTKRVGMHVIKRAGMHMIQQ